MLRSKSLGAAGSQVDLLAISAATNATPIVITLGANSGVKDGDRLAISGVTGNTGANGIWTVKLVTATTFQLLGSVGNGTTAGTIRCAQVFDTTPLMKGHTGVLSVGGNGVLSITFNAFQSYSEFAAADNSLLGAVPAPVKSKAELSVTNTDATSASSSTIAASSFVLTATGTGLETEIIIPYILWGTVTAYTSGTITPKVQA